MSEIAAESRSPGPSAWPLSVRLALLAFLAAAGIVWAAALALQSSNRELERAQSEIASLDIIADEVSLAGDAARIQARAGAHDLADLGALERTAVAVRSDLPSAPREVAELAARWHALLAHPTPAPKESFIDAAFRIVSSTSDASGLSFESNVETADLGDALDNGFFNAYVPLRTAGTLAAQRRRRLSVADRIGIAGLLARSREAEEPLRVDIEGARAEDPQLDALAGAYAAAERADASLRGRLAVDIASGRLAPDEPRRLARALAAADAAASAFNRLLQRAAVASLQVRMLGMRAQRWTIVLWAALASAGVVVMALLAAVLVSRRDRRALERVDARARTLAAELARSRAEENLLITEAQFDAIFDRSQLGIAVLDESGRMVETNPALREMLGSERPLLFAPGDAMLAEILAGTRRTHRAERLFGRPDGRFRWIEITVSAVAIPSRAGSTAAIAMVGDITERRALEDRLRHEATHDPLTSLPNRAAFVAALAERLESAESRGRAALLYVDLDRFKFVNDTMGHPTGDKILFAAAKRLVASRRPSDLVARLHGDEFAVLLGDVPEPATVMAIAERIRCELLEPLEIGGTSLKLAASIGVVAELSEYRRAEDIMRDADTAMYAAKSLGGSRAVAFETSMNKRLAKRMRLMTDLNFALERRELRLLFQPLVDLESARPVGLEALLRWEHPTLGRISPVDFIPLAEESDAIISIGRFVLFEAARALRRLEARGHGKGLRVGVNVAVTQLATGTLVDDVRAALLETNLEPRRLALEITESALLDPSEEIVAQIAALKALGVELCIDDFGTGYSALRSIQHFPFDVLKIDRTFVSGRDGRIASAPIVAMLLTLGRSLELSVVAEGIETSEQRRSLLEGGCRTGQGYLFAKPLEEAALDAWLARRAAAPSARSRAG
ncbi:MAG: putative bifunctional diguanylate cyclase/phosphodiesterase [Vulcanimicrobiaceae bacterium]